MFESLIQRDPELRRTSLKMGPKKMQKNKAPTIAPAPFAKPTIAPALQLITTTADAAIALQINKHDSLIEQPSFLDCSSNRRLRKLTPSVMNDTNSRLALVRKHWRQGKGVLLSTIMLAYLYTISQCSQHMYF